MLRGTHAVAVWLAAAARVCVHEGSLAHLLPFVARMESGLSPVAANTHQTVS